MNPRRRRSTQVTALGTAAFAAVALTGCGSTYGYQGICRDTRSNVRVDDGRCENGSGGGAFGRVYFPRGGAYPPVGRGLGGYPNGVTTLPQGSTGVRDGAAARGGTVPAEGIRRGGFGFGGHGDGVGG